MSSGEGTIRVILTGATGMVGEGVLLVCLEHPAIEQVLVVGRKPCGRTHAKLTELLVPDFLELAGVAEQMRGYDACLYCAGISSQGMTEAAYSRVTYDTPIHFAETLVGVNPAMVFAHVSGAQADSSERGRVMWARVKGKAENALMRVGFARVYNFRPGLMQPTAGQRNVKPLYKVMGALYPVANLLFPKYVSTMREVGLAMIHSVLEGYPKTVLEVVDIRKLAQG